MIQYQSEKKLIREYFEAIENSAPENIAQVLASYVSDDYSWQGVYPFRQQQGAQAVAEVFWIPLMKAFSRMQRREDIFIAGNNKYGNGEVWVMSMGNFMGLFDQDILGIPHTRRLANLRYAEFNCVENGVITRSGLFVDLIGLMMIAGVNPLPPSTGTFFNYPGPRTHDGLLFDDAPTEQSSETLDLLDRMIDDLSALNDSGSMGCSVDILKSTWSEDMLWYGPAGVGATYTIERYQEQHQLPFRENLEDKKFHGHECRFAEGNYACFFGWPNLSNSPIGGWLGLPGGSKNAEMQVVDVYRREGDKLVENWIFIDIPYWLSQQGLDVFARSSSIFKRNSTSN
ncbi:nuclear transport factor 2 family protein [Agarilytica rhodophyticola]|uniref:nuclear transport factor 2 family protein n=1 Tax=Agarilytica rhodophyticola TaxID=1737490 RepID=UPI000B3496D9|nr:nuclear transport factor 2 family protein [Agarilytica rhodophyticola]